MVTASQCSLSTETRMNPHPFVHSSDFQTILNIVFHSNCQGSDEKFKSGLPLKRCSFRSPSLKHGRDYPLTPVIRQGCFQSVIKRIIKILWATIAIPRKKRLKKEIPMVILTLDFI
jgi:hypothetical protein